MQLNPNWSQVGKAERALIMLASFDAWTLEEVAYLSAGILPPGPNVDYSDMPVQYFSAKQMLIALERAKTCVNGMWTLSWDGCLFEGEQIGEEIRFSAGDLLTFMCARFGEKSQQRLLEYRKMAVQVETLESLRQFEFSQRPIETPTETKAGLLLSNGHRWETKDVALMCEAAQELWEPAYRGERGIPTAAQVEAFLIGKKVTPKKAKVMASILRPENLPARVSRNFRVTQ